MSEVQWDHKEEWHRRGSNFLVVVKHHTVNPPESPANPYGGPHRWNVYAYIYPKHPRFKKFKGRDMWQDAAIELHFHCGPSFLRWHYDDNKEPTSVQVGSDYSHLHDDRVADFATKDEAWEVFDDADQLFDQLAKAEGATNV
jgi:hypothetical protein